MACFLCGVPDAHPTPSQHDHRIFKVHCPVCGAYSIEDTVVEDCLNGQLKGTKHLLAGLSRQAFERGNPLKITSENVTNLFELIPNPLTPLENLNQLLLFVRKQQTRGDKFVELISGHDFPLTFAHDGNEFDYLRETLIKQGLLEHSPQTMHNVRLTPAGWQRVIELKKHTKHSNQAFVAMWFSDGLTEAYENGIKKALEDTGFSSYRVDHDEHNQKIDDRIIAEIRKSGLLIADFTGHRGGVYFEAGFAMGLGIPVIWTCKETDIKNAHFDTRQYNHITWINPAELKTKLIARIEASIPGIAHGS